MMKKIIGFFILIFSMIALFSFQNCSKKMISEDTPVVDYSSVQSLHPDCTFNRMGLMENESVRAYRTSTVPTGQNCVSEERICRNGGLTGSFEYGFCLPGAPAACLFNGQTISPGSTVRAFLSTSVPYGSTGNDTCEAKSELRTCLNGVLSGTMTATTCVMAQPTDCNFNGQIIRHGGRTDKLYKDAQVGFGQNCLYEIRYCKDGVLSGSYTNPSCRIDGPQVCLVNGHTVQHNATEKFFNKATVAYNEICPLPVDRTCTNGSLSGSTSHIYTNCIIGTAANCTSDGETINHNDVRKRYSVQTVPAGSTGNDACEAKTQMRKCINGKLDGDDIFQYKECRESGAPPPPPPGSSCTTADAVTVADAQTREVRKTLLIRDGNCEDSTNKEVLYCHNGTFKLNNINGAVVNGAERYANCTDTETTTHEGLSGGEFIRTCPNGAKIMGFTFSANYVNEDIDGLRLICSSGSSDFIGSVEGANALSLRCPEGTSLIGLRGRHYYSMFSAAAPICASDNGGNRSELSAYGWDRSWYTEFYTVCKPGYVVNRVRGTWNGTSIMGMRFECVRVATSSQIVNVNCQGRWIDQGCDGEFEQSMFYIFQYKGGNGAECSVGNKTMRQGSYCGGGGGGNDQPR